MNDPELIARRTEKLERLAHDYADALRMLDVNFDLPETAGGGAPNGHNGWQTGR